MPTTARPGIGGTAGTAGTAWSCEDGTGAGGTPVLRRLAAAAAAAAAAAVVVVVVVAMGLISQTDWNLITKSYVAFRDVVH